MRIGRCWRAPLIFALVISLNTACGPPQQHGGHAAHLFGMRRGGALPLMSHALRLGLRSTRGRGFRRACADDVARFCQSAKTRREERQCLEGRRDSLDAGCKSTLERRRDSDR